MSSLVMKIVIFGFVCILTTGFQIRLISSLRQPFLAPIQMLALYNDSHSKNEAEMFQSLSILGVCGSIGSGKSYACSLLKDKLNELQISSYHLDTDSIAHGVYAPGSQALQDIALEFGEHIIKDGNVDRKALGAIVFSDPARMSVSLYRLLLEFYFLTINLSSTF